MATEDIEISQHLISIQNRQVLTISSFSTFYPHAFHEGTK